MLENLDYRVGSNRCMWKKVQVGADWGGSSHKGLPRAPDRCAQVQVEVPEGADPDYLRWGQCEGRRLGREKGSEGTGTSPDVSGER